MALAHGTIQSGGYRYFLHVSARQLQRSLCGRSRESARQCSADILPRMHDREDLNHSRADAIEERVRSFEDLPDLQLTRLRHVAARLRKVLPVEAEGRCGRRPARRTRAR